jgi:hydrogenase/urease accessory protein HupE
VWARGARRALTMRILWAAVLVLSLGAARAAAHPLQFSYVDVSLSAASTDVAVTVHAFDAAHDLGLASEADVYEAAFVQRYGAELAALLAGRLTIEADGRVIDLELVDVTVVSDQQAVVVRMVGASTSAERLGVTGWLFPYDPVHQTFVQIYEQGSLSYQDILTGSRRSTDYEMGAGQGRLDVFSRFLLSGIEHIVIGPDHVLFLVGLLLLGGRIWRLVRIVTGFTVAHSVTLSLAALGMVTPPARVVEPAIALSICYVGVDNLMHRPGGRDHRTWIAFAFGLVHGFGFANVLQEMQLPRHLLGWSLFAFNVGVEVGQVAIVAVVAFVLAAVVAGRPDVRRKTAVVGSLVVIWAGFYWLVERLFFA